MQLDGVLKFGLGCLFSTSNDNDDLTDVNLDKIDFSQILGHTNVQTGHWLTPQSNDDQTRGWVLFTDQPFNCEPSLADQNAADQMLKGYFYL